MPTKGGLELEWVTSTSTTLNDAFAATQACVYALWRSVVELRSADCNCLLAHTSSTLDLGRESYGVKL